MGIDTYGYGIVEEAVREQIMRTTKITGCLNVGAKIFELKGNQWLTKQWWEQRKHIPQKRDKN